MKKISTSRAAVYLGLTTAAVLILLVVLFYDPLQDRSPSVPPTIAEGPNPDQLETIPKTVATVRSKTTPPSTERNFAPDDVIGNRDCLFQAGHGNAAGTGLVVLPGSGGYAFEVLDGNGRVFGDVLPFKPNHHRLAKDGNGSVLAGFADLRRNLLVYRDEDSPEPIRIFRDGQLIYEAAKVWDFGLAPDGSAFFVIEPTAGLTSQLLIYDLEKGTQYQHDLGYEYTSQFNELPYTAHFTVTSNEVMMAPSAHGGTDSHLFYPVDGSAPRKIRLQGVGTRVFESLDFGYFVFGQGDGQPLLIQKKEFLWTTGVSEPKSLDVWTREIDLEHFYGDISLSNDGEWLLLGAWVIHVLDTSTGETVFTFPIATPYEDAQLARISNVLKPGATVQDIGDVGHVEILDGQLLMYRTRRNTESLASEHFFDVFDMSRIQLNSKPVFRVQVDPANRCEAGDFSLRGLQVENDALTYLTKN
ncbi:MAG: hypothetical protein OXH45_04200 [Gammaproteobacteria bacterium]|nr:hypothetical protein [Gammaproteobacteria bacterium]